MIETLLKLGLSEKEAKIYLATLEIGTAPASKIAQKSGLNRVTTYVILEKLAKLGLATSYDKGNVRFYTAENPEQLDRLIRNEETILRDRERELRDRLPELKALYSKGDRPKVMLYDSSAAATEYYYSHIKPGSEMYGFTDYDGLSATGGEKESPSLRLKKRIATNVIYTRSAGPLADASSESELRQAKHVTKEIMPFQSVVVSIEPKQGITAIQNLQAHTTLIIEDKQFATSMKAIFDYVWQAIK